VVLAMLVAGAPTAASGTPGKNTAPRSAGETSATTAGAAQVFSSSDVPKTIPDNDPNGATSSLTVQDVGPLMDVNLILDNLTHACVPDLHIEVTSPAGTTVVLVAGSIENGILAGLPCPDDFISTVLDDQATVNLRDGTAPYTGSFNVEHASVAASPLSAFAGESADGTWTLRVADRLADDTGTLNGWSLALRAVPGDVYSSSDVPKPIPDNDPAGVTSTLEVAVSGSIEDLDLILSYIPHTCVADLRIELTSPGGKTGTIIVSSSGDENGILVQLGCGDNFNSTSLSDQATVNLRDGTPPYVGSFNVDHASVVPMPLAQFNGESARGTWTLAVKDLSPGDTGTLEAWGLRPRLGPAAPCDGDFNHSGNVSIDELVRAVGNALNGCP
jgi:subtilisin-like proprotein convertase family protein